MTESESEVLAEVIAIFNDQTKFVRAIFSGRRRNMQPEFEKIEFRPIKLKDSVKIQMICNSKTTSKTSNLDFGDSQIQDCLASGFANFLVESTEKSLTLRYTKKGQFAVHVDTHQKSQNLSHDRQKSRLLDSNSEFLRQVGISDQYGRVKPTMNDKFMQIEEFLRILMPTLESEVANNRIAQPTRDNPLKIVDHGCGNAYLTFAVHEYLTGKNLPNTVIGIDKREDTRERNAAIAERLAMSDTVNFRAEKISESAVSAADIAIALHACDTATDDALAWSIMNGAKIILVSPCCHHDLQDQMTKVPAPWQQVTKHGILNQRLGDVLTDALRAQILRFSGYRTEIIEFIGDDHTPRNLMIRAVKTNSPSDPQEVASYSDFVKSWSLRPKLAELIDFLH